MDYANDSDEVLVKLWQDNKDVSARDTVLSRHNAAFYKLPGEFRHIKGHLDYEDLVQEAIMSFIKSMDKFNVDHGSKFFGYAYTCARFDLMAYIDDNRYAVSLSRVRGRQRVHVAIGPGATLEVTDDCLKSSYNPPLEAAQNAETEQLALLAIKLCTPKQRFAMAYMLTDIKDKRGYLKKKKVFQSGMSRSWKLSRERLTEQLASYRSVL